MLRSLPLLLVLLLGTCVRAQEAAPPLETKVSSTITDATVFLEGAQVGRRAKSKVPAGRATLVFTGLTPDLDPNSLQVSAPGNDFIILSVSHRLNFGAPPAEDPKTGEINAKIRALDRRKDRLDARFLLTKEEEAILALNREVASPQTGLDAEDLIRTVNFHRERLTALRMAQLGIADSLGLLKEERQDLQRQLAELGSKRTTPKATAEVVVVTEAKSATTGDFSVQYLVPNASWIPHYDVRVSDVTQPVDLRFRANVQQRSGEDWTNVRLRLSTGDPSASAIAPTLNPWRLYAGSRPPVYRPAVQKDVAFGYKHISGTITDETGAPLIGAGVMVPGGSIGTVTDLNGNYSLDVPAATSSLNVSYTGYEQGVATIYGDRANLVMNQAGQLLDEVVVTGYGGRKNQSGIRPSAAGVRRQLAAAVEAEEIAEDTAPVPVSTQRRATTVTFDIELPYTIPSDGKTRDVEIKQHQLPATYTHLAVPKLTPDAYLTAAITDWEKYDLLSGETKLFFEGTYLGKSYLDVASVTDTLEISLGRDPNVVVDRKATDDYRKRNFFGGKVSESRGYTIAVRNKKGQPIRLLLLDQVPISTDEDITVKNELPANVQHDEKTGILEWQLNLAPLQETKVAFGYEVKYPREKRVFLE
ncbi:mucoidy inhibitor MuiA family protein [Neolewinella lacunae]|uniref:DUF4139 domain-containing protein n=1 Tax=Neolewinella lacunae TaxID=1517758 RepID=A0A923PGA6_9BACT|nr:mucoidy inhibitor MuiA family protein [Neolewinella lacunae]MBC6993593.1 DUF4139 domain-containing protein [Neolewinella lacunae]MDN3633475.1 mucoidy inhibitor MuiA family protein [Neolewinella lacunae]